MASTIVQQETKPVKTPASYRFWLRRGTHFLTYMRNFCRFTDSSVTHEFAIKNSHSKILKQFTQSLGQRTVDYP